MSMTEVQKQVDELRELTRMAEELSKSIEGIKDCLKAVMVESNTDELIGVDYRITYKTVTTSRMDTAALKKALPDIAATYTKTTTARRFVLA